MLSVIDIIRALSELVQDNFPDYPLNDKDLEEGFPRPSYYISVDTIRAEMVANGYQQESADLELYFFAEDLYSGFLDLLEMKDQLIVILSDPLPLTADSTSTDPVAHVVFNDVQVEISFSDKALKCSMTSNLIQGIPPKDDDLEYVDTLVFTSELNEEV